MNNLVRWAVAFGAALMLWAAGAGAAEAQLFCRSDNACGATRHCVTWFGPVTRCEFFRCNADADCPNDRACLNGMCTRTLCNATADCPRGTCIGGVCRRPAPPAPPASGGGGSGLGGQGATCGKITENGVPRVYPACAAPAKCQENRCVRPLQ